MKLHRLILLLAVALLSAACVLRVTGESSSAIGGEVQLGDTIDEAPFYDTAIQQALIDARQLSSAPLAQFTPSDTEGILAASVQPIGRLGDIEVGTWMARDPDLGTGLMECIGYKNGDRSSGATCGEPGDGQTAVGISFHVDCGDQRSWLAWTVNEDVAALRFDVADDVSVVGDDPLGTGLVAVEAVGRVTRATAETTDGQIWLINITGLGC